MSRRKGRLQEIFSKAIYADDPKLYIVSYRDFDSIMDLPLLEFVRIAENFELIPLSRISSIRRENKVLYQKKC
ncbi:MAG: DUF504 domain-containing protein [Nitrososphaeraceae archaeon]